MLCGGVLLLSELVMRLLFFRISTDFSKFPEFPKRASVLMQQKALRVALIGNSTTYKCTDAKVVQQVLQEQLKRPVVVDAFAADGSSIETWYYLLNHYFWQPGKRPDLFIVTFYNDGILADLADGENLDLGRLAQFLTGPRDWPEVFQNDIHDPGARVEYLLSGLSSSFAAKERMKRRLLDVVVPHYRTFTQGVNLAAFEHQQRVAQASHRNAKQAFTYTTLQRFLEKGRGEGSRFIFVAYPTLECTRKPYALDRQATRLIQQYGADFVDMRHVPRLTASSYEDKIHISKIWTPYYSERLGLAIAPVADKRQRRMMSERGLTRMASSVR